MPPRRPGLDRARRLADRAADGGEALAAWLTRRRLGDPGAAARLAAYEWLAARPGPPRDDPAAAADWARELAGFGRGLAREAARRSLARLDDRGDEPGPADAPARPGAADDRSGWLAELARREMSWTTDPRTDPGTGLGRVATIATLSGGLGPRLATGLRAWLLSTDGDPRGPASRDPEPPATTPPPPAAPPGSPAPVTLGPHLATPLFLWGWADEREPPLGAPPAPASRVEVILRDPYSPYFDGVRNQRLTGLVLPLLANLDRLPPPELRTVRALTTLAVAGHAGLPSATRTLLQDRTARADEAGRPPDFYRRLTAAFPRPPAFRRREGSLIEADLPGAALDGWTITTLRPRPGVPAAVADGSRLLARGAVEMTERRRVDAALRGELRRFGRAHGRGEPRLFFYWDEA